MPGEKLRFRFSKTGTLRLLSHHDLMRCLERMLRRAALPFKSTGGFHPTPRVVFALSLPLGVEGLDEVVEIEFTESLDEEKTLATLRAQAPAGLAFTRAVVVPMRATALPRRVVYELDLPTDRVRDVAGRCADLMGQNQVWVERLRPNPKRLNIRPYFRVLSVASGGQAPTVVHPIARDGAVAHATRLNLDLWVTQTGTARADELLNLLGVADLPDAGVVIRRLVVELRDEVANTDPTDSPPDGPADARPLDPVSVATLTGKDDSEEQPAVAEWGASPAGPVVE